VRYLFFSFSFQISYIPRQPILHLLLSVHTVHLLEQIPPAAIRPSCPLLSSTIPSKNWWRHPGSPRKKHGQSGEGTNFSNKYLPLAFTIVGRSLHCPQHLLQLLCHRCPAISSTAFSISPGARRYGHRHLILPLKMLIWIRLVHMWYFCICNWSARRY
jgi:hypothetical protein